MLEIPLLCSMRVTSYTGIFQKLFAFVSPLFRFRSFELTLPETNIGPKTPGLEDEFPFEKASCQVRTVSFREGRNQSSGIGIGLARSCKHVPCVFASWKSASLGPQILKDHFLS